MDREPETVIYVVDDHPSVRKGIENLLSSAGFKVKTFCSPEDFLKILPNVRRGCLLLDLFMPGMGGLQLQRLLADSDGFLLPVVIITGSGDVPTSVNAMKLGAVDFIQKPFEAETLFDAIDRALEKNRAAIDKYEERSAAIEKLSRLSPREKEVMELAATGLLNKQIADKLGISEKTVKNHKGSLVKKIGVYSAVGMLRLLEKS